MVTRNAAHQQTSQYPSVLFKPQKLKALFSLDDKQNIGEADFLLERKWPHKFTGLIASIH